MPLKLSLGLSEKRGLPNYGSIGATCGVELELDASLLDTDIERFHRRIHDAYGACRQAVREELARQRSGDTAGDNAQAVARNGRGAAMSAAWGRTAGNGQPGRAARPSNGRAAGAHCGNTHAQAADVSRASQRQCDYLQQLARQIHGLGVQRLDDLTLPRFGKPVAELTGREASLLIRLLRAIQAGQLDLDATLQGTTP